MRFFSLFLTFLFLGLGAAEANIAKMKRVLSLKRPAINRCYQTFGDGLKGDFDLHYKVDRSGRIYASGVGETQFSRNFQACVIRKTWNTVLSQYGRPYRLKHTLHFR